MTNNVLEDLTKYELQTLLWAIDFVREKTNNCGDTMRVLQRKVQDAIDRQCQHEYYLEGIGNNAYPKCHKCGYIQTI